MTRQYAKFLQVNSRWRFRKESVELARDLICLHGRIHRPTALRLALNPNTHSTPLHHLIFLLLNQPTAGSDCEIMTTLPLCLSKALNIPVFDMLPQARTQRMFLTREISCPLLLREVGGFAGENVIGAGTKLSKHQISVVLFSYCFPLSSRQCFCLISQPKEQKLSSAAHFRVKLSACLLGTCNLTEYVFSYI